METSIKHTRAKRATLNFVGDIAGDLFGILGSHFKTEYVNDINKLAANDEHLMLLLKNHTSILDASTNIIKKNQEELSFQGQQINAMTTKMHMLNDTIQIEIYFQSAASYILHELSEYEHKQDALLDVFFDSLKNHVNPDFITPNQLKQQVTIISDQLSNKFLVPEDNDLYKIIKLTPFIVGKTFFCHIKIPLFLNDNFQIYKIIQFPHIQNSKAFIVNNNNEFIISSLNRQHYQFMSRSDLQNCVNYKQNRVICFQPKQWFSNQFVTCAWNLFLQHHDAKCQYNQEPATDFWYELKNKNNWLFSVFSTIEFLTICGNTVSHHEIHGEGLLSLNPNCMLQNQFIQVHPHSSFNDSTNNFVLPKFTYNSSKLGVNNEISMAESHEYIRANLTQIQKMIEETRNQLHVPNKINKHDIHHYSISYLLLTLLICLVIIWYLKGKKSKPQILVTRSISMPNLSCGQNVTV